MRRTSFVPALAACVALSALGLGLELPAQGRDRPEGPSRLGLSQCDYVDSTYAPVLCGVFHNETREHVKFEMEATKDGAPFALDALQLNCKNLAQQSVRHDDGSTTYTPLQICYTPARTYGRKINDVDWDYVFETGSVDWSARYCVRLRARRVPGGIVSVPWSDNACVTVPPAPAAPSRPDFDFSFSGTQMRPAYWPREDGGHDQMIPSELHIVPHRADGVVHMELKVKGGFFAGWSTQIRPNRPSPPDQVVIKLAPDSVTLAVELCAYNYTGHACKLEHIDPVTRKDQSGALVPMPLPRATLAAHPLHVRGGSGSAPPRDASDQTFMAGVDLPGSDYRNEPLDGTAVDCQAICTRDGNCKAWAWVKAGVQNTSAMCWLKNGVPASRAANPDVTSGIKSDGNVR